MEATCAGFDFADYFLYIDMLHDSFCNTDVIMLLNWAQPSTQTNTPPIPK